MNQHTHRTSAPPTGIDRGGKTDIWANPAAPQKLPPRIEQKLIQIEDADVRAEFTRSLLRVAFEVGLDFTDRQLDVLTVKAAEAVRTRNTRGVLELRAPEHSLIYYIQFDTDAVKIGTTIDLRKRLESFYRRPTDVLATEPGDRRLETLRHQQFAADLIDWGGHREMFRYSDQLRSHVQMLRNRQAAA